MGLSLMVEATMFSGKTVKILLILSGIGTIAGVIFSQQNETFLSIKNISLLLGFVITIFHVNDIKEIDKSVFLVKFFYNFTKNL
jgi:hypothetical protein